MPDLDPPDQRSLREEALIGVDPEDARATYARIAFLAQCFAGTSSAQVAIVEPHHVWRAGAGEGPDERVPRDLDFPVQVIAGEKVAWIEDATQHRRLRRSPQVAGPAALRFFAGAPIRLANGARIGAVVVADRKPRPFDAFLAARLEDFAALVAEDWDRRRQVTPAKAAPADDAGVWRLALAETVPVALVMTDRDMRVLRASPRWLADRGVTEAEIVGKSLLEPFPGDYTQHVNVATNAANIPLLSFTVHALATPDGGGP